MNLKCKQPVIGELFWR